MIFRVQVDYTWQETIRDCHKKTLPIERNLYLFVKIWRRLSAECSKHATTCQCSSSYLNIDMSDRPSTSGKRSKSRLLRPINDLFSKSFSRSPSPSPSHQGTQSVTPNNAIASASALPTNCASSASQVNPQSHEAQSVTADNPIASITVSSANSTTSTHQVNPQSPQGTPPITPDTVTASTSASRVKSATPVPQVNPQGTEYMAILELSPTPSGPLTWDHRMKARGSTAYEGLKTAIQGVYDCSAIFPPLHTTAGVLLTICKVVDVSGSMYSVCCCV